MAEKKYLDESGLSALWNKVKGYFNDNLSNKTLPNMKIIVARKDVTANSVKTFKVDNNTSLIIITVTNSGGNTRTVVCYPYIWPYDMNCPNGEWTLAYNSSTYTATLTIKKAVKYVGVEVVTFPNTKFGLAWYTSGTLGFDS